MEPQAEASSVPPASTCASSASEADRPRRKSAGDIGDVIKTGGHELLHELSASAQKTKAASSAALKWLRRGAERQLGIEVSVEDPAIRELFGHLLQVESLLSQIRSNAECLARGALLLSDGLSAAKAPDISDSALAAANAAAAAAAAAVGVGGSSGSRSSGSTVHSTGSSNLKVLADNFLCLSQRKPRTTTGSSATSSDFSSLPAMIEEATWKTVSDSPNAGPSGSARYNMQRRLQQEVMDPLEEQFSKYDHIRELLRSSQGYRTQLVDAQKQVASLRKHQRRRSEGDGDGGSKLQPLDFLGGASRLGGAEESMQTAQAKVAESDSEALSLLLVIKKDARQIVARPWAALSKIRAEFFAVMSVQWAPVATALCDPTTGGFFPSAAARTAHKRRGLSGGSSAVVSPEGTHDPTRISAAVSPEASHDPTGSSAAVSPEASHEPKESSVDAPAPFEPPDRQVHSEQSPQQPPSAAAEEPASSSSVSRSAADGVSDDPAPEAAAAAPEDGVKVSVESAETQQCDGMEVKDTPNGDLAKTEPVAAKTEPVAVDDEF